MSTPCTCCQRRWPQLNFAFNLAKFLVYLWVVVIVHAPPPWPETVHVVLVFVRLAVMIIVKIFLRGELL